MSSFLPPRREREQMRAILGQHINAAVHAQGVGVPRRNAAPLEAWLERQGIWRWSARRPSMAGTKSRRGCSLSAKTKGREARVAGLGSGTSEFLRRNGRARLTTVVSSPLLSSLFPLQSSAWNEFFVARRATILSSSNHGSTILRTRLGHRNFVDLA